MDTRAILHRTGFPGIRSWPTTKLQGAEFIFAMRHAPYAEACREVYPSPNILNESRPVDMNGFVRDHWTVEVPAARQEQVTDFHTTFLPKIDRGTCLIFALAVHFVNNGPANGPLAPTPQEMRVVRAELRRIFSTVQIETK